MSGIYVKSLKARVVFLKKLSTSEYICLFSITCNVTLPTGKCSIFAVNGRSLQEEGRCGVGM